MAWDTGCVRTQKRQHFPLDSSPGDKARGLIPNGTITAPLPGRTYSNTSSSPDRGTRVQPSVKVLVLTADQIGVARSVAASTRTVAFVAHAMVKWNPFVVMPRPVPVRTIGSGRDGSVRNQAPNCGRSVTEGLAPAGGCRQALDDDRGERIVIPFIVSPSENLAADPVGRVALEVNAR